MSVERSGVPVPREPIPTPVEIGRLAGAKRDGNGEGPKTLSPCQRAKVDIARKRALTDFLLTEVENVVRELNK